MTDTPTIDEQIAAVRQARAQLLSINNWGDVASVVEANRQIYIWSTIITNLEQLKLALAVVGAAVRFRDDATGSNEASAALWDALDAFDAGEKPR